MKDLKGKGKAKAEDVEEEEEDDEDDEGDFSEVQHRLLTVRVTQRTSSTAEQFHAEPTHSIHMISTFSCQRSAEEQRKCIMTFWHAQRLSNSCSR